MRNLLRICLLTFSMLLLAAAVASADSGAHVPVLKQYRAAFLQWYPQTFTGNGLDKPRCIAFDGSHIWVGNSDGNSVSVFNATDGTPATSFGINGVITGNGLNYPNGMAFDGSHVWVANQRGGSVSVFNASDGSPATSFGTNGVITGNGLAGPEGIAFDGNRIWVAGGDVSVFNAADGTPATGFGTNGVITGNGLSGPRGIAFDGSHIWVTNQSGGSVSVFNAADGTPATGYGTNGVITGYGLSGPSGIAFDGNHIWVVNHRHTPDTVCVFNAADGTPATSFGTNGVLTINGKSACISESIAFDGSHIWVSSGGDTGDTYYGPPAVNVFNAADGTPATGYGTNGLITGNGLNEPCGMAFDGANMWATDEGYTGYGLTRIPVLQY